MKNLVYKLLLPMDDNDLKIHPRICFDQQLNSALLYKIVSFRETQLWPSYRDQCIVLRKSKIRCLRNDSSICLTQVKSLDKNLIEDKGKYFWNCSASCSTCQKYNGQLYLNLELFSQEIKVNSQSLKISSLKKNFPKMILINSMCNENCLIFHRHQIDVFLF